MTVHSSSERSSHHQQQPVAEAALPKQATRQGNGHHLVKGAGTDQSGQGSMYTAARGR